MPITHARAVQGSIEDKWCYEFEGISYVVKVKHMTHTFICLHLLADEYIIARHLVRPVLGNLDHVRLGSRGSAST